MYLIIEIHNGNTQKVSNPTQQQLQALMDTEDYIVIKIEAVINPAGDGIKTNAWYIDENLVENEIQGGVIHQNGAIVMVQ